MGGKQISKVHLTRGGEDFIVIVEDTESFNKWKSDSSIPLIDVVNGFNIFTTHGHGAQGVLDTASKATLDSAFGTSNVDDVIKTILQDGQLQNTTASARESSTNDSIGSLSSHR
jgi:ribosome maturation protein Sdo1